MSVTAAEPLWVPSSERVDGSNLRDFARATGEAVLVDGGYDVLHRWSIAEPERFWRAVWDWAGVVGNQGPRVVEAAPEMWRTRFFPDASLNFAANLLRRRDDTPAILFAREDGARGLWNWRELHDSVSRIQQALVAAGVVAGDRVAAFLPNVPEVYALMLAAASIGAVFSSCSPDFGARGVLDRFGQIEPTVLVGVDGYLYDGKRYDTLARLRDIRAELPTVRIVPVLPALGDPALDLDGIADALPWDDWLAPYATATVGFDPLPFDHPLYVLYSSGTTGLPKCIVHRAGGVLLKHLAEQKLQCDVRAGDRVLYFTTTGWMMWNWLASALASEATLVVYDGSPAVAGARVLWDLADEVGVTLFGTSAKFLDSCRKLELHPAVTHSLASVRTITSTGSPLSDDGFAFVYGQVKADVHLASISGGTDLCGCLVGGDPTGPVYAGEIQRPGLGMDIAVFDAAGRALGPGEAGELVCRAPFPSMPLGLWDDPGDARYRRTYFEEFPGVWHQGDFAEWTEHGGMVIHGRSDATLNPGGVRIGTAEIYRQVETIDDVVESLVIGQDWDGDVRVVLFVVLRDGATLTDALVQEIRSRIRTGASPGTSPRVFAVADLPRTRSGKLTELAVRDVVHGRPVKNVEALANPEALDQLPLEELPALTGAKVGRLRSLLFAPASRPDVVSKLPRSGPDGVVLDLEDAVPPAGKEAARAVARELGARLAAEHPELAVFVRVNAVASEWFADDVPGALTPGLAGVVVPKLESVDQLATVVTALAATGCAALGVVAGIETAAGVGRVEELLRPPVTVAYFGAEDFIADMGGVRTAGGAEVLYARSRVALAARLGGAHALDQIVTRFDDEAAFLADAEQGRAIGYPGKLCIHPNQVAWSNRVFSPSPDEVEHAPPRRLLAAYESAAAAGEAAIVFDGQMVDEPMARRARAVLSLAPAAPPR